MLRYIGEELIGRRESEGADLPTTIGDPLFVFADGKLATYAEARGLYVEAGGRWFKKSLASRVDATVDGRTLRLHLQSVYLEVEPHGHGLL